MKPELIITHPQLLGVIADLGGEFTMYKLWESDDPEALIADISDRIRGIGTNASTGASAEFMDRFPNLEMIGSFGVGLDKLDIAHGNSRGVIMTNTPTVLAPGVAETALCLMLATGRRIAEGDRYVRAGRWPDEGDLRLGHSLFGKRLGIVGLGDTGRNVAKLVAPFDMDIAYFGPRRKDDVDYTYYADLVEMARDCDILVVSCIGGPETHHLINAEVMEALGPEGMLVNVARGSVVDEQAAIACLSAGKLGSAGLDVFEHEPQVPDALTAMDNVVLLPHCGSASVETRQAMGDLVAKNIRAYFAGEDVLTPVT